MSVTARVSSGVKAIEVTVSDEHTVVTAVVTREALEEFWEVGPQQEDLLEVFHVHSEHIRAEILRRAQATGKRRIALRSLKQEPPGREA
jgi:hypothetical protein